MPTVYLRNVPAEVVEALKRRAESHGRSLNAEAVALLSEVASEPRPLDDVLAEIRAIAAGSEFAGLDAVELVRQGREDRTRRVLGG